MATLLGQPKHGETKMTKHVSAVSQSRVASLDKMSGRSLPSMATSTNTTSLVGWAEIVVFFASIFSKFSLHL